MKKILFMGFLAVVLGLSAIAHANAYTISGSVKDSSTNQGIPAATVTVRNGSNAAVATISTDQAGNYTTTVATAGDYYASAAKAGYDDFSPPPYPIGISDASPAAVFNMVLTPAGAPPATLSLSPGWNLISLPLQPADNAIASVLSGIAGKYSIVWGDFDPATQQWKFKGASGGGSLNTMDAGKAYWIYIADTKGALLTVKGKQTEHSITLKPGWNFIGYNKLTETAAADAIISIAGKFSIIWGDFNPTTQQWKFKGASGSGLLNRFESGKGYWIRANQASLWTLPSGSTPPLRVPPP